MNPGTSEEDGASLIARGIRRCCMEAVAAGLARYVGSRTGFVHHPVDLGLQGQHRQELPHDLPAGDGASGFADRWTQGRHGLHTVQGPEAHRHFRSTKDGGGPYGWALQPCGLNAEDLKNNWLISTKYDSESLVFSKKHVVIFANFKPDMTKWSADPYLITDLNQDPSNCTGP